MSDEYCAVLFVCFSCLRIISYLLQMPVLRSLICCTRYSQPAMCSESVFEGGPSVAISCYRHVSSVGMLGI